MSANLDSNTAAVAPPPRHVKLRAALAVVGEPLWVIFSMFGLALVLVVVVMKLFPALAGYSETAIGQLVTNVLIYALAVGFVLLPLLAKKVKRGDLVKLLGFDKGLTGAGIGWALVAFAIYFWVTVIVGLIATQIPGFDSEQPQDVGFNDVSTVAEYIMAFIGLVILPPLFEEILFRGYLFGRLRRHVGFWLTTIVTSITFGFVHGQWNVGLDTFVLSIFLCYLREYTGSIWPSILLHGIKNSLAYFFLFIAPLLGINLV